MQKGSLDSLKNTFIKLDFREEWISELVSYIEQSIDKGAVLILLFGSRAKRDFLKDSDIDLLIVSQKPLGDIRDRALDFLSDSLPVQPFVMTPAELEERIEKLDFLIFDAFEDGIALYSEMDMDHINDMHWSSVKEFDRVGMY